MELMNILTQIPITRRPPPVDARLHNLHPSTSTSTTATTMLTVFENSFENTPPRILVDENGGHSHTHNPLWTGVSSIVQHEREHSLGIFLFAGVVITLSMFASLMAYVLYARQEFDSRSLHGDDRIPRRTSDVEKGASAIAAQQSSSASVAVMGDSTTWPRRHLNAAERVMHTLTALWWRRRNAAVAGAGCGVHEYARVLNSRPMDIRVQPATPSVANCYQSSTLLIGNKIAGNSGTDDGDSDSDDKLEDMTARCWREMNIHQTSDEIFL